MAQPQFDITIDKNGQVRVKVSGTSGAECLALTDMLRDNVGREESRELTNEYYDPDGRVRIDATVEDRTER